jgi:hypothetical protein
MLFRTMKANLSQADRLAFVVCQNIVYSYKITLKDLLFTFTMYKPFALIGIVVAVPL